LHCPDAAFLVYTPYIAVNMLLSITKEYPEGSYEKSYTAAMHAPKSMPNTDMITEEDGLLFRRDHSATIVMKMENRRSAVNMGRLSDLVDPRPQTTFPRNRSDIGNTSRKMDHDILGTSSLFIRTRYPIITEVDTNCKKATKLKCGKSKTDSIYLFINITASDETE